MDTSRLKTIQQPKTSRELLRSFAATCELLPTGARNVDEISELPGPLQRIAARSDADEVVWLARVKGLRVWFLTATASLELSRERRRPVLQIRIYDEYGEPVDSLNSVHTTGEEWQRCS